MSFRTVVVKKRSKLDLNLNYLVCRNDEETKVFIPEISVLILESTAISLTTALISELVKNNVKIIFCDEKHNPESELFPIYGSYDSFNVINKQLNWSEINKAKVWTYIIHYKIKKQQQFLADIGRQKESKFLEHYIQELELNDVTNREGHAAKVYFNAVWGMDFSRRSESFVNAALNYGYAVLLACFNRVLVSKGYLTQLGIWHKNEYNEFNLACDLMEPFRTIIDKKVFSLETDDKHFKTKLLEIFEMKLKIDGKEQYFENALAIYVQSVLDAIEEGDVNLIKMYE